MDICRRFISAVFVFVFTAAVSSAFAKDGQQLSLWIAGSETSLAARQAIYLTKHVEERLPNQFQIQKHFEVSGSDEFTVLEKIRHGDADIAIVGNAVVDAVPRLSLFRLPWLFASREHVQQALYAGLEDEIRTHVEAKLDVVVIGVYDNAFHQIRAFADILKPKDFRHLRLQVGSGREMRDMLRSFGAIPQKIPSDQLDEAIRKGTVDSIDGDLGTLARLPIGAKLPVINLTQHIYEPAFFIASRKFWISLTNVQRAKIANLGADFSDTAAHLAVNYSKAVRQSFPNEVTFKTVPPEPFAKIRKRHVKAYEKKFGREWLDLVEIGRENAAEK